MILSPSLLESTGTGSGLTVTVEISSNSLEHPLPSVAKILYCVVIAGVAGKLKFPPVPLKAAPTKELSESSLS